MAPAFCGGAATHVIHVPMTLVVTTENITRERFMRFPNQREIRSRNGPAKSQFHFSWANDCNKIMRQKMQKSAVFPRSIKPCRRRLERSCADQKQHRGRAKIEAEIGSGTGACCPNLCRRLELGRSGRARRRNRWRRSDRASRRSAKLRWCSRYRATQRSLQSTVPFPS